MRVHSLPAVMRKKAKIHRKKGSPMKATRKVN
jgi:hypothetical protein